MANQLQAHLVGKNLHEVQTPAVVLDIAKVERNCQQMLDAVKKLDLGWRAHIKTHKTIQLTRLQVGDGDDTPANIIVSTILEAENVLPLLKEYQQRERKVNVLFAFPVFHSGVERLSKIARELGVGGLSLMVDHPDQLSAVEAVQAKSGVKPLVFLKIDMGYRRAGVPPDAPEAERLIDELLARDAQGSCVFHGIYAHAGNSYNTREDWQALDHLAAEFASLEGPAKLITSKRPGHPLTLSVGATPTAISLQHPDINPASNSSNDAGTNGTPTSVSTVNSFITNLRAQGYALEVHAGVYPVLDLQQLATHARDASLHSAAASLALTVLADVASLYPRRGPDGRSTEALVNAGCLALGREPCADMGPEKGRHYAGWGIVAPWGVAEANPVPGNDFPAVHGGWQVGKVSQEHGILRWYGHPDDEVPLAVGQKVRIWPNHACIAGAGFNEYLVIDSRRSGQEDVIVDVWPRWNGW